MNVYKVVVYRQGYIRVESTVTVEAETEEQAVEEAISLGVESGMDIIRNDLEITDTDAELYETPTN